MTDPPLVQRALALERQLGFERSCIREVGMLLHVLAAQRGPTAHGRAGKARTASFSAAQALPRDPVREFWLNHPEIAALEILTTPTSAAIVGARNG